MSAQNPFPSTLAGKIAQASIDAGAFRADKINPDQHYSYISADQVLSKAGDALAHNGVTVLVQLSQEPVITLYEYTDRNGNKKIRLDARVAFEMVVTDGHDSITASWYGYGSDYATPDKAVYKAITSGHKYYLMKLLNIGVGNEDSEHEAPERSAGQDATISEWDELAGAPMTIDQARSMPVAKGSKQTIGDLTKPALDALLKSTKSDDVALAVQLVIKHDFNMTPAENGGAEAA
jgi:hypothetical protein